MSQDLFTKVAEIFPLSGYYATIVNLENLWESLESSELRALGTSKTAYLIRLGSIRLHKRSKRKVSLSVGQIIEAIEVNDPYDQPLKVGPYLSRMINTFVNEVNTLDEVYEEILTEEEYSLLAEALSETAAREIITTSKDGD